MKKVSVRRKESNLLNPTNSLVYKLSFADCLKALFGDKGSIYLPKMEFQKLSSYLNVIKKLLCPEIILWKTVV
jgi:hypothetical protein